MATLISLLILVLIGALIWYVIGLLPIAPKLKQIIQIIVGVIFILYLLGMLGGAVPALRLN
jgi:hypothetical protein